MKIEKMTKTMTLLFMAVLLMFTFSVSAYPLKGDHQWGNSYNFKHHHKSHPDNLRKTLTFVSTRPFDSVDGTFFLDGLVGGDGMGFFKDTMEYSDEEIDENRKQANDFFMKRFGLDTPDPRLYSTGFEIDPAADYRVLMMSGENKKIGKGYQVLDGGWGVVVLDPLGIDLGGEFEGVHVPAGSMFVYGNYVIKLGRGRQDLVIDYKSRAPILRVGTGSVLNLEVSHPQLGQGVSLSYSEIHSLSNGQISAQARNVLTFPKFGYKERFIEK